MVGKSKKDHYLRRAKSAIPGISQLLSKRPDQFGIDVWPTYFLKAEKSHVWDLDGNRYLDMSISGIGANVLGYRDLAVNRAVGRAISSGNSSSLNCPEEVDLAELLLSLHPWAEKVRYARTGGEAMAIAVRIARAATGKDLVLFCGYHGWHDWYLAANLGQSSSLNQHLMAGLEPNGVPRALAGSAIPFTYNQPKELQMLLQRHRGKVAAIVMEPVRSVLPSVGYLDEVRSLATQNGAALIFDEISSGFRHEVGGYHLRTGVTPDVAVFAKAMSNGYAMAAIIGIPEIMNAASKSFISSTYWTERIGPTAALATIKKIQTEPVVEKLEKLGQEVQRIWQKAADEEGLKIEITGLPAMSYLKFLDGEANIAQSLYTQEMVRVGILASGRYYANFSQTAKNLRLFERSTQAAFAKIGAGLRSGVLTSLLLSDPARPGFGRLN